MKVSKSLIHVQYPGIPIPNSLHSLLRDQTCSGGVLYARGLRPNQDSSEGSQPPCPGSGESWAARWMHPVSFDHDEATCFICRAEEFRF